MGLAFGASADRFTVKHIELANEYQTAMEIGVAEQRMSNGAIVDEIEPDSIQVIQKLVVSLNSGSLSKWALINTAVVAEGAKIVVEAASSSPTTPSEQPEKVSSEFDWLLVMSIILASVTIVVVAGCILAHRRVRSHYFPKLRGDSESSTADSEVVAYDSSPLARAPTSTLARTRFIPAGTMFASLSRSRSVSQKKAIRAMSECTSHRRQWSHLRYFQLEVSSSYSNQLGSMDETSLNRCLLQLEGQVWSVTASGCNGIKNPGSSSGIRNQGSGGSVSDPDSDSESDSSSDSDSGSESPLIGSDCSKPSEINEKSQSNSVVSQQPVPDILWEGKLLKCRALGSSLKLYLRLTAGPPVVLSAAKPLTTSPATATATSLATATIQLRTKGKLNAESLTDLLQKSAWTSRRQKRSTKAGPEWNRVIKSLYNKSGLFVHKKKK
eukprot:302778_1